MEDVENTLDVDLNKLTKKELLALCAERKIEAKGNKKELVAALEKAKADLQTLEAISAEDVEEEIKLMEVDALVEATVATESSEAIEPVESTGTQEDCTKESTEPAESVNYAEMTKKELEKLCIEKNLPVKGNKTDLISRLEALSEDNPSIIKPITPEEPATEPINETMEEPVTMTELENENAVESPDVDSSTEKTDAGGDESVIEQEKILVEESAAGPTDDTGVDADAESVKEADAKTSIKLTADTATEEANEIAAETIVEAAVESTLAQTAEPTIDLAEPIKDLYALTKRELEKLCKSKGLSTKGNKKDLIASLEKSSAVPKDDNELADEHVESASISESEATDEPESIAEPEAPIESQTAIEETESITEPETAVESHTATEKAVSNSEPATVMEETESSDEPNTAETEAADKITEDPTDITEVEAEKAVEPETAVEAESVATDLTKLTKKNLEKLCLEKNLPIKGNKKDLIKLLEKTTEELNKEVILPEAPEQIQLAELEASVSEAELSSTEISGTEISSEENVQEITNEDIPAKDHEDSVSDEALKESETVHTLSILDLMQTKKTGELDQEELYRILLTSAQNNISQSQKISELEKRLEDAEARIEKLEVKIAHKIIYMFKI